jgi:hypothetical protein
MYSKNIRKKYKKKLLDPWFFAFNSWFREWSVSDYYSAIVSFDKIRLVSDNINLNFNSL